MPTPSTVRTRLRSYLFLLLLGGGLTAIGGCDVLLPLISDPEGPGCTNTCEYAYDLACDDGGPGSEYSLCDLGTDCADCGTRGDGADVGDDVEVPGGCESGDYESGYGAGDEQVDYMCQAAWAYRCAGDDDAADAQCAVIRDYAGNTTNCPYC